MGCPAQLEGMKARKQTNTLQWTRGGERFHVELIQFSIYVCKFFKMAQRGFFLNLYRRELYSDQRHLWKTTDQIFIQISKSFSQFIIFFPEAFYGDVTSF